MNIQAAPGGILNRLPRRTIIRLVLVLLGTVALFCQVVFPRIGPQRFVTESYSLEWIGDERDEYPAQIVIKGHEEGAPPQLPGYMWVTDEPRLSDVQIMDRSGALISEATAIHTLTAVDLNNHKSLTFTVRIKASAAAMKQGDLVLEAALATRNAYNSTDPGVPKRGRLLDNNRVPYVIAL